METGKENSYSRITLTWMPVSLLLFIVLILSGALMRALQAGMFRNLQEYFYPVMTLHGIGMAGLWFVASMAGVVFVSAKYVRPSLGAQYFSLACTIIGVVMLIVSTLIGKFASGWYFLYPLPFKGSWPAWSTHLFLAAIWILGIGWLVWSLDYLRAVGVQYKLGHALGWHYITKRKGPEVPPFITISTMSVIVCLAALVSAVCVLIFYYLEMFTGKQNDALLMKNLTFFFGHLLVNLSMYLGVSIVYDLMPDYTGRAWKNNRLVALAWNFVLILVLFAYFHHLYMDFAQPLWMQYAGQIASYVSSIPAAVMSIFGVLAIVYRSRMKWNLTSAFFFLGVMGWAIGGVGAVIDSTVVVNERFHNTLWVPAHFHTYMIMGLVMIILGFFYHVVYTIIGREQNRRLSRFILLTYLIGGYGLVGVFYYSGAHSIPRRYAGYTWDIISSGTIYAKIGFFFSLLILVAVLIYFFDLVQKWTKAILVK